MAQLVARLVRNEKVGGSNPPSSTTGRHPIADVGFLYALGPFRCAAVPVVVGLKDKTCWFYGDFSACWCGKIAIEGGCFIVGV